MALIRKHFNIHVSNYKPSFSLVGKMEYKDNKQNEKKKSTLLILFQTLRKLIIELLYVSEN